MKLSFLVANNAWVFTFGDSVCRMGSAPLFFVNREDAIFEAKAQGLKVDTNNNLSVI
tara:strand:+ start:665 stop:835 length:171 start_codon:yes stop_codon:yes gene_type:complete